MASVGAKSDLLNVLGDVKARVQEIVWRFGFRVLYESESDTLVSNLQYMNMGCVLRWSSPRQAYSETLVLFMIPTDDNLVATECFPTSV